MKRNYIKGVIIGLSIVAGQACAAAPLEYDPRAQWREEFHDMLLARATGCMRKYAELSLRGGERNAAVLVAASAEICGVAVRLFLKDEYKATDAEAWGYTLDISRAVIKRVPGVTGVR